MKNTTIHLLLYLSFSFCLTLQAQQTTFYYNYGKKVQLEIDFSRVSVVSEGGISSEKVKSKMNNSDFIINNRMRSILKQDSISNDKLDNQKYEKEIITSEIVFPDKKEAKAYYDFIKNIQKEQGVIKATPTYLLKNFKLGISNKFLVKIKKASDVVVLESLAIKYAIRVLEKDEYLPDWYTLSCTKECPFNAVEAANYFYETKHFLSAEPEFIFKVTQHSVDPYFSDQWELKNTGQYGGTPGIDINVEAAWTKTTGSPNIKVAVFDSGIEMDHPDLENVDPNLWYDVNYPDKSFHTYNFHGTTCAGIIGATKDNGIGISGVAPGSTLISIGFDNENATASQLASGFSWARTNGVDVISCSWGFGQLNHAMIDEAIDSVFEFGRGGKGCVVVFSVGNQGEDEITYPANSDSLILTVGAISPCGERKFIYNFGSNSNYPCDSMLYWGSNFGTELDVVAPGVFISTIDAKHFYYYDNYLEDYIDVLPTSEENGFNSPTYAPYGADTTKFAEYTDLSYTRHFFGTSAACPFVAGIAALVLSKDSNLTVLQANNAIERTATKLSCDTYTSISGRPNGNWGGFTGYGLVNADSALLEACNKNIEWEELTGDTTIFGCKIHLYMSTISSGANVVIKADETIIDGEFEVPIGATLEITNNEQ